MLNNLRPVADPATPKTSFDDIEAIYEAWRRQSVRKYVSSYKRLDPEDVPAIVKVLAEYGMDLAAQRLVVMWLSA